MALPVEEPGLEVVGKFVHDYYPSKPWSREQQQAYRSREERQADLEFLREVTEREFEKRGLGWR